MRNSAFEPYVALAILFLSVTPVLEAAEETKLKCECDTREYHSPIQGSPKGPRACGDSFPWIMLTLNDEKVMVDQKGPYLLDKSSEYRWKWTGGVYDQPSTSSFVLDTTDGTLKLDKAKNWSLTLNCRKFEAPLIP